MKESIKFILIVLVFLGCFFLPIHNQVFFDAIYSSFVLVRWYAREHVLLCLVPAFLIAGAISQFLHQGTVLKYLGPNANKILSYLIASVSGVVLTVCSCTVLPLFSSIHKRGAGLGPAIAFLYSGPAINVLAIILTARILSVELGIARAVGAVLFSIVIGYLMYLLNYKEEKARVLNNQNENIFNIDIEHIKERSGLQNLIYFAALVGFLIFANWGKPLDNSSSIWNFIYASKWYISFICLIILGYAILRWFKTEEIKGWLWASWDFSKQILPLLLIGVWIAGFLFGPNEEAHRGIIPKDIVYYLVGGNSIVANFIASIVGAFMYFATLTEVPILSGLIQSGMGKGPALALLLSGPALSLPSMLVIRSVLGTKKTIQYVTLVVIFSTILGLIYGNLF